MLAFAQVHSSFVKRDAIAPSHHVSTLAMYPRFDANSPLRTRVQKGVKVKPDNQQTNPRTAWACLARGKGDATAANHL